MFPTKLVALGLAILLGAGSARAQEVTFTGVIEKAYLASYCQEETHYLTCSGALLKSTTLDLDKYVGQIFEFGAVLGGVECPIWNITSVEKATATLVHCGNPVPGCPMRFRVGPAGPNGQYALWYSLSGAFLPIDTTTGTWMLGAPFAVLGTGPTQGPASAVDITLPPNPALTGIDVFVQGARLEVLPGGPIGPLELTNPTCFKVWPSMPPCSTPDC